MGRRGPAPKPTNLRVLHGEKPYRINRAEPRPRELPPEKPGWLSAKAAAEWDRVAPDLEAMGTVKAVDAAGLAAYCEAVALLETLSDLVARSGPLLAGPDGQVRKNPVVAQRRDASAEVRMWAREFGFTPSARQPLRVEHAHRVLPAERLLSLPVAAVAGLGRRVTARAAGAGAGEEGGDSGSDRVPARVAARGRHVTDGSPGGRGRGVNAMMEG